MKKYRLKKWVRVVLTVIVIHLSFFIWRYTGTLGDLAQHSYLHLVLCVLSWIYLLIGQVFIYEKIWKKKKNSKSSVKRFVNNL